MGDTSKPEKSKPLSGRDWKDVKKYFNFKIAGIIFILMAVSAFLYACSSPEGKQPNQYDVKISFKLDERLFGPTYGGERWVPPPYGPIAYSGTYTIEARAYRLDSSGQAYALTAEWVPEDPQMVTVSPAKGEQVKITINGLGETSLKVKTSHGKPKTLYVKTTSQNGNIRLVEITNE